MSAPDVEIFEDHIDDCVETIICPITKQPCMTEQDEFCGDYGCARKAGYSVDDQMEWL